MTMQDGKKLQINISAASRHPEEHDAYDQQEHRYKESYVQPTQWQLMLSAQLPPSWEQCEWQIENEEAEFKESIAQNRESDGSSACSVAVPAQGHYDIALVVQMAGGEALSQSQTFHLRDYLFVALGDSYFCGEGNPDEAGETAPVSGPIACNSATFTKFLKKKAGLEVPMKREAVWQEKQVHRSYKSGVSHAARRMENKEAGRLITFLNFARSGASIKKGFFDPREEDDWTTIGQLEEAAQTVGDRPIDVLLISGGGNDIQFSDRLIDLMRDDLPIVGDGGILGDDAVNRKKEHEEALRYLAKLPDRFDRLAEALKKLDADHVFITPYPLAQFDIINDEGVVVTKSGCGIFDGPDMDIDEKDAEVMKDTGRKLNKTIREAAEKYGWHFVRGIVQGFAGHGRCSDDKYFYSAEESCFKQGDFRGTLHPNEKGNEVYADCISRALEEQFWSNA